MVRKTQGALVGDFLLSMDDESYSVASVKIRNSGATAYTDFELAGLPVIYDEGNDYASICEVGLLNFDQTDVNGIIVSRGRISSLGAASTTEKEYAVLVRGPATIERTGIATNEVHSSADAYTLATIESSLEGTSPPIRVITSTALTEEQTA